MDVCILFELFEALTRRLLMSQGSAEELRCDRNYRFYLYLIKATVACKDLRVDAVEVHNGAKEHVCSLLTSAGPFANR